jgi:hypothetical protein
METTNGSASEQITVKISRGRSRLGHALGGWLGGLALLGLVAWVPVASAEDDPPPPQPMPPLPRLFAPLKEAMKDLPPFLRDTDLKIHFRTYYINRENPNGSENEA